MEITTQMVKELREQTGAGIMAAKRALQEAKGNMAEASAILQQQGLARAEKKAGRQASQGVIEPYIHGSRIGVLVELDCETDFVARTQEFRDLAHDLAMQVAATAPRHISPSAIPGEVLEEATQRTGNQQQATQELALLAQPFIKDPKMAVEDVIKAAIGKLGENIVIRRFSRIELGGGAQLVEE